MSNGNVNKFSSRTALEALRSGVPNREAVKILGSNQPDAESEFQSLLDAESEDTQVNRSMLISGDFGTGKSHMLEYCEHLALSQNFVCSMFSVSKQTPFYNLDTVYKSAIDNGVVPNIVGQMIDEICLKLDPHSEGYADFFRWVHAAEQEGDLHTIFPATLITHERSNDLELLSQIQSFWSGGRILQNVIKNGLKTIGQDKNYQFRAPKVRDLPPQRLRFALELVKAAGYRGWVILIDEIELVGSYSILQRARSYAELARWMGLAQGEEYPGLVVVGSISEDFELNILNQRGDRDTIVPRLRARGEDLTAARADAGMRSLSDRHELQSLDRDAVQDTINNIREIYSEAYGWPAPEMLEDDSPRAGYQQRMRYRVRSAINQWDLQRLYPDFAPDLEVEEHIFSYTEDQALSSEIDDDEPY